MIMEQWKKLNARLKAPRTKKEESSESEREPAQARIFKPKEELDSFFISSSDIDSGSSHEEEDGRRTSYRHMLQKQITNNNIKTRPLLVMFHERTVRI
jgi:hypothetical protein